MEYNFSAVIIFFFYAYNRINWTIKLINRSLIIFSAPRHMCPPPTRCTCAFTLFTRKKFSARIACTSAEIIKTDGHVFILPEINSRRNITINRANCCNGNGRIKILSVGDDRLYLKATSLTLIRRDRAALNRGWTSSGPWPYSTVHYKVARYEFVRPSAAG